MKQEEVNKLAHLFKTMTGRPYRSSDELTKLLKAINEYNRWKNQQHLQEQLF